MLKLADGLQTDVVKLNSTGRRLNFRPSLVIIRNVSRGDAWFRGHQEHQNESISQ